MLPLGEIGFPFESPDLFDKSVEVVHELSLHRAASSSSDPNVTISDVVVRDIGGRNSIEGAEDQVTRQCAHVIPLVKKNLALFQNLLVLESLTS
jgi:hypothetical protein